MKPTRREFSKLVATYTLGLSTYGLLNGQLAQDATNKPSSKIRGVQLGINVPYSFGQPSMGGDEILANVLLLGLNAVELRAQPVESFLGAASEWLSGRSASLPENIEKLRSWRRAVNVEQAKLFREKYERKGVLIEIMKVDRIYSLSDEELDYCFGLAHVLGARAISTEISTLSEQLQRIGTFADKHRMMVGYHGHATTSPALWEKAFALAKYNGANLDLGHFIAGNETSPIDFLKANHERITHIHLKDRKRHNGPNVPFGEGDTPLGEALHLIRDNQWPIQATIEFEYPVPGISNRMAEISKTIEYCRRVLMS